MTDDPSDQVFDEVTKRRQEAQAPLQALAEVMHQDLVVLNATIAAIVSYFGIMDSDKGRPVLSVPTSVIEEQADCQRIRCDIDDYEGHWVHLSVEECPHCGPTAKANAHPN